VFWQCVFNFFEGFIENGVVNVILPALEKRYDLSSSKSAIIASANDFGAFVLLIVVGYFGERRHKPKLMGIGVLVMALGCLLFSLPQFFYNTE
jgi:MFS family permease